MDMNQMQAEMAKYQQEIVQIQAKYAGDTTAEGLMKMQQEMGDVSRKMTELSMNFAAESMSGLSGGSFDAPDLFSIDLDDDDAETEKFIQEHPAPADKARYLPIGALLLITNGEPYETFAIMGERDDWLEAMEDGWGIEDADEGKKMLASLVEGRHEAVFGDDFRLFKADKADEIDEDSTFDDDSIEGYEENLENIEEDLPALLPYAQKCDNLLAWDLDRLGYLARIFTHLGWIEQDEAFGWIEKAAEKIKEAFSCWEEYIASILIGRAVHMGFNYAMVGAAQELLEDNKAFLDNHPFSEL